MSLSPALFIELLALGCACGFLAGMLGIGGGMLLVPALTFIASHEGFPADRVVKMAVATSLATILFTSVSSVRAHHKRGGVRWRVVKLLAPGVVFGSLLGAQIAKLLSAQTLALVFAVFVAYSAAQMFLDRKPTASRQLPQGAGMFGAGAVIGTLSALVGAGGGFISVPFMTWCNVSIHTAVATSSALGFPIALAGTIGYVYAAWGLQGGPAGSFGYLYLPALALVGAASVLFAPVGAKAAHRLDVKQLKRAFACLLFVLAAYMASKGLGG
jgi:uncharacterized membrane protein YfcA